MPRRRKTATIRNARIWTFLITGTRKFTLKNATATNSDGQRWTIGPKDIP